MPGPTPDPVHSDPLLPRAVDVVVIGGGIIGCCTALELAERGVSVALCEKGVIGGEQSSRNWGWVRISLRDAREIPLMVEAIRLWEGMEARVGGRTGYRKAGILFGASDDKTVADYDRWSENLAPYQMETRLLSGAEIDAVIPGHQAKMQAALWTPGDGRAEPQWAAPSVARGARRKGAHILTGCAVRSLDMVGGQVRGVVTEYGRVACQSVVLAGGAWSRLFAGNAGINLPQVKVLSTAMRTAPLENGPEAALWHDDFAIRKRADGGYTIAAGHENVVDLTTDHLRLIRPFLPALRSDWDALRFRLTRRSLEEALRRRRWRPDQRTAFEAFRILDPAPSMKTANGALTAARKAFPVLENARVAQTWAGLIDVTPDVVPVISDVPDVSGFFIATGFSGHGFGIGPGAGRLMADLVTGSTPVVDPVDFRLSRFSDGSPIELDAGF